MDRASSFAEFFGGWPRLREIPPRICPNRTEGCPRGNGRRDWTMIRTIWLAAVCLAVVGAVAVGRAYKTTATPTAHETPANTATAGADLIREPLIKADRLQITPVRQEALADPASQPINPVVPDVQKSVSSEETIIVSRHWHDPSAMNATSKSRQFRRTETARKGRSAADPRSGQTDHAKPAAQIRPCNRTGVGDFLRSLNLSPACDS
jgi:hypothetical protein